MIRGRIAAGVAATAVGLAALAVVQAAVFAASGAYLLIVAPLVGLPLALAIYRTLHRLCSTGGRFARAEALAGSLALAAIAIVGISFGGFALLLPAVLLAIAAGLTPSPARA